MIFEVVCIYNKKDRYADNIQICRTPERFAFDFANQIIKQNQIQREKGLPTMPLSDFEIRHLGQYDDTKCEIIPKSPTYEVIPFSDNPDDSTPSKD